MRALGVVKTEAVLIERATHTNANGDVPAGREPADRTAVWPDPWVATLTAYVRWRAAARTRGQRAVRALDLQCHERQPAY